MGHTPETSAQNRTLFFFFGWVAAGELEEEDTDEVGLRQRVELLAHFWHIRQYASTIPCNETASSSDFASQSALVAAAPNISTSAPLVSSPTLD